MLIYQKFRVLVPSWGGEALLERMVRVHGELAVVMHQARAVFWECMYGQCEQQFAALAGVLTKIRALAASLGVGGQYEAPLGWLEGAVAKNRVSSTERPGAAALSPGAVLLVERAKRLRDHVRRAVAAYPLLFQNAQTAVELHGAARELHGAARKTKAGRR